MPLSASFDSCAGLQRAGTARLGMGADACRDDAAAGVAPLRHVRERSFARRRTRAMLLVVLGYLAVWMAAGMVLQVAAVVALMDGAAAFDVVCCCASRSRCCGRSRRPSNGA